MNERTAGAVPGGQIELSPFSSTNCSYSKSQFSKLVVLFEVPVVWLEVSVVLFEVPVVWLEASIEAEPLEESPHPGTVHSAKNANKAARSQFMSLLPVLAVIFADDLFR